LLGFDSGQGRAFQAKTPAGFEGGEPLIQGGGFEIAKPLSRPPGFEGTTPLNPPPAFGPTTTLIKGPGSQSDPFNQGSGFQANALNQGPGTGAAKPVDDLLGFGSVAPVDDLLGMDTSPQPAKPTSDLLSLVDLTVPAPQPQPQPQAEPPTQFNFFSATSGPAVFAPGPQGPPVQATDQYRGFTAPNQSPAPYQGFSQPMQSPNPYHGFGQPVPAPNAYQGFAQPARPPPQGFAAQPSNMRAAFGGGAVQAGQRNAFAGLNPF
jgi:hypothetical protein